MFVDGRDCFKGERLWTFFRWKVLLRDSPAKTLGAGSNEAVDFG